MVAESSIEQAATRIEQLLCGHPKAWTHNVHLGQTLQYLWDTHAGRTRSTIAVIGNAFLLYGIGGNWWAARPVVHEELLLSLDGKPVDLPRVLGYLEQVARQESCAGVAVGTSFSLRDPALIRLYRSHGYADEATMLYKEIT